MDVTVPIDWTPRPYQMPLWTYLENGGKRAVAVWHRRAGKDNIGINWTVVSALQRPGLYWHVLPTYNQGRKVVWDGRGKDGRSFLSYWPSDLIVGVNNTDMKLELKNGSIWQVVGSDNPDRLVGANPVGVVMSEYSLQDPQAWDFLRPILAENEGWAMFIYTARGRNHGYNLMQMAERNPAWFCERLTVEDTKAIPMSAVQDERDAGMPEEMIQQEFFCSFDAPLVGSYYGNLMAKALEDGRITSVPYDPALEVHTAWDLGMDDSMSIGFFQLHGQSIRWIDYYENSGEGLAHYIGVLRDKPYEVYGDHYAPHDIMVRELGTGKSRLDTAKSLGLKFRVGKKLSLEDGINAVRGIIPLCWFDDKKCERLVEAARQYRKEWDDKKKVFAGHPLHDWTSHPCDMLRTAAIAIDPKRKGRQVNLPRFADTEYKMFGDSHVN